MTKTMLRAYAETNEILKYLPKSYVDKIPQKLKELFEIANVDKLVINIDPNKTLEHQKIQYETRVILTILKVNYWTDSEEEKVRMQKLLIENDEKSNTKYDLSALFTQKTQEIVSEEKVNNSLPMNIETESWYTRLVNKIKKMFKK